jgi:hypothetical protein
VGALQIFSYKALWMNELRSVNGGSIACAGRQMNVSIRDIIDSFLVVSPRGTDEASVILRVFLADVGLNRQLFRYVTSSPSNGAQRPGWIQAPVRGPRQLTVRASLCGGAAWRALDNPWLFLPHQFVSRRFSLCVIRYTWRLHLASGTSTGVRT